MELSKEKIIVAERIYLILAGLFITALVTGNLIFQKFFSWDAFGLFNFELSVGILPYPATFVFTDIISEIYGKRRANRVVTAGFFASAFTLLIIIFADAVPATMWSPLSDGEFTKVFGFTFIAVGASMAAYLSAQFVDVHMFHFWKRLTKGKYLWLRNNASTFTSQFLDTCIVLLLLCSFDVIEWHLFGKLLLSGFLFKVLVAMTDTPIIYAFVWFFRKYFGLKKQGDELKLENSIL